jgi:hypothetical protein
MTSGGVETDGKVEMNGIRFSLVLVLAVSHCASAQTRRLSRAEAEKRADALLTKITSDEKLTLVGGIDDFYTQAIPRLGIPQFRMSDACVTGARRRLIPLRLR